MNYYYITKLALIVSDEEIKGDDYLFKPRDGVCMQELVKITDFNEYRKTVRIFSNIGHKKVIAGIPELPSINYSKLSPEEQNRLGNGSPIPLNIIFMIL